MSQSLFPTVVPAIYALAAQWSRAPSFPGTAKERDALVKAFPVAQRGPMPAARFNVEALAAQFTTRRKQRHLLKAVARLGLSGQDPKSWPVDLNRLKKSPSGVKVLTLQERLHAVRVKAVKAAYAQAFRVPDPDHGVLGVHLTHDPAEIGVSQVSYGQWGVYKRQKYPVPTTDTTVAVRPDWRHRVQQRGLAIVDGLLTLDATPLDSRGEIELFDALWAVQGRGYQVTTTRGVLARCGKLAYHGTDAEQALRGLQRKLALAKLSPQERAQRRADLEATAPRRFAKRYAVYGQLAVRWEDAEDVGACADGIRSWCENVGINSDARSVPLSDVLAGYVKRPLPEARATILHVVRRGPLSAPAQAQA